MVFLKRITPLILLLILNGCATLPTGPSVNVLPAQGKTFETFRTEDATCRQWAEQQIGKPVQDTYDKNLATGAVAGTAIGAGLGAAVGSASGHAGAGAAIGAASGLLFGSAVGSNQGQVSARQAQRRYDNSYSQCMYSYGNQVPGYRRRVVSAPPPMPPSPPVGTAPLPMPLPPPAGAAPPPLDVIAQENVPQSPPPDLAQNDVPPPPPPAMSSDPGQYAPPPEFYSEESPQFLYTPELNMYVAVGVPYDLLYTGNEYFYFYGRRWYHSPYYNGPWVFAPRSLYPPILLSYRIGQIRHFRNIEFKRYRQDRAHYKGRIHRPVHRGERRK